MANVDQRRFNNQPSRTMSAREAAAYLGIQLRSLYVYVSRGLLQSVPGPAGTRQKRYLRADVERLKARHDARAGHGPVAAGALRWGEPVLDTQLTAITPEGPRYRGHSSAALATSGVPFESVAELLWTGTLPAAPPAFTCDSMGLPPSRLAALLPKGTSPLSTLAACVPLWAAHDRARFNLAPPVELDRGRALVRRLAAALALGRDADACTRALAAPTIAHAVCVAFGLRPTKERLHALDFTLILVADHELNPSSFAARVTASANADLYACVSAALAVMMGPLHGSACDRDEALVAETRVPQRAAEVLHARASRGELIPGLGHPLYPQGDPRTPLLLDLARKLAPSSPPVRTLLALADEMRAARYGDPTVDLGVVAIAHALGLGPGSASALFALGRSAGWIAHALEQRSQGFVLRPRARYVGVA
jgi:citrate synthase